MIRSLSCFAASVLAVSSLTAASDFKTGQKASYVVGQDNFSSNTTYVGDPGLSGPTGIAISPVSGKLFVCDTARNRILRFASVQSFNTIPYPEMVFGQTSLLGTSPNAGGSVSASSLFAPEGIYVDSADRLWVADTQNNRVLRFDSASLPFVPFAAANQVLGKMFFDNNSTFEMMSPKGVFADKDGNVWVADSGYNRVLRFDAAVTQAAAVAMANVALGQPMVQTSMNNPTLSPTGMSSPVGVTGDAAGHLWVADRGNNRVLRFDDAGTKLSGASADGVLGQPGFFSKNDGLGRNLFSTGISGLWLTPSGQLFIADRASNRVVWLNNAATKNLNVDFDGVLGQPDFGNSGAFCSDSTLSAPSAGVTDSLGRLWLSDRDNNRVLRFDTIADPVGSVEPSVTVAISGKKQRTTMQSTLVLKGTASDVGGTLARVEVKVGKSAYKSAKGTASWKFKAKLKPGKNKILVHAVDANGAASAVAKITVSRN